jgi:hypothetical protein
MAYSLSLYLQDAAALLRDNANIFTSKAQLTRYINQGRRQAARRSGCIRLLLCGQSQFGASAQPNFFIPGAAIPGNLPDAAPGSGSTNLFQTIPNVESYPFRGFINPFLRAQYDGADAVTDIFDCAVNWGQGSYRPVIQWLPWIEMQSYMRAYANLNSAYSIAWSTMGDGDNQVLFLWPPPNTACELELEVFAVPKALYTDDDVELLPDGFTSAIAYYAAGMAYLNSRPAQAMIMLDAFADRLGVARFASDYGKMGMEDG